ncbi:glycosyltransferase family 39 protein [Dermatobacter hominis]|uniref:glycosyltransferase family 39 protein n=1 Tax=Dermatobacter hominis TaxID=2884263 RepID=UPI001D125256|nr:glycosyltransferase family 39 protein [Dermatobacter hominis]UDY36395.1 glycosyltransferase family 39 protein [Dermatobacter hominis]
MRSAVAPAVDAAAPPRGAAGPSEPGTRPGSGSGPLAAPRPPLWAVPVAVGAALRALHWALVNPDWVPRSDARQYVELARSLAAGDGLSSTFPGGVAHATAFRPPLYPALLAVPTRIAGPDALWPGRALSLVLGLVVIALTVTYARRIAGDRAGLVAGLAVAVAPALVANDTVTVSEPLGLLLLLGILLALLDDRWALAGALSGLLLLARPNAALVVVVVAVVLWRAVGWRRAAAAVGVCLLVVAPWAVRNAVQVGTPRLVTSDGFTLAALYGPPAIESGLFEDPTGDPWYERHGVRELERDEAAWSDRLVDLGVDGMRSNPDAVLRRAVDGAATMLELPGHRAVEAEYVDGRDPAFRDATLVLFPILVAAGLAGTVLRRRDRRTWPAIAIVGTLVALSLVTVSVPRLRGPFDLLMCVGVGYLAAWLHERRAGAAGPPPGDAEVGPSGPRGRGATCDA